MIRLGWYIRRVGMTSVYQGGRVANQPFLRLSLIAKSPGHSITSMDLAESVKAQITRGAHLSGCKMPPVRVLAHQLAVSKNTVQAAYNELVDQDVLESRPRVELFVSDRGQSEQTSQIAQVPVPKLVDPLPGRPFYNEGIRTNRSFIFRGRG
jgi:DNA-binding transcriptional regulator YhcF (GntR family)